PEPVLEGGSISTKRSTTNSHICSILGAEDLLCHLVVPTDVVNVVHSRRLVPVDTFVSRRGLNVLFQHEGIKVQFLFAPGAHNLVNKVLGDASGVVRLIQQVSTEKVVRSVGQLIQIKLITDVLCRWSRSTSAATTGGRSTPGSSKPRNLGRVPPTSVANQQLVGLRTLAKLPGIFGCDIPLTEPLVGNQSLVPEDILVGVLPEC